MVWPVLQPRAAQGGRYDSAKVTDFKESRKKRCFK